jgi:predicted permease
MITRLRTSLTETHGAQCELVRHFLARLFDSETSAPGEWQKVAVGLVAAMLSLGILALTTYWQSFDKMREAGLSPQRIYQEICADELTFIAAAMGVTALFTALLWQSLFPSLRDCLALAGLPISGRQIFAAKFGALLLAFGVFVLALNLPWAMLFAAVTAGSILANFAATGGGCVFVFFTLMGCQGVLLLVLPARAFGRVSLAFQAAVLMLTLGFFPLFDRQPAAAAWWPPVWFLNLWKAIVERRPGASYQAVLAMTIPASLAVLIYLLSYHRYRRLLLEAPPERAAGRRAGVGAWLLELWIHDPRQQAAFAFIWKTLARSRSHRLLLLAYAGIALGAITKGAVDMPRPSLRDQGIYGLLVVLAPLALALLVTVGLRYLFSLPTALNANWVFQTTDREGRTAWLAAVERFVICCGIVPVFLIALPAAIAILGPARAAAAITLALLAALLCFELLFRRWRKLPFTCSYVPGRQPASIMAIRYALASVSLGPAAQLILYSSGELTAFAALATFEAAVWWRFRNARRKVWSDCALCFEETDEAEVMALDLQSASEPTQGLVSGEPQSESGLFSNENLVASRGLLPEAWREELEQERRHPYILLETALEDVRYAFRLIGRNPGLSLVVVLILTVGIGINASVFTVVSGVAFRPHVYKDPASFIRVVPVNRWQRTPRAVSYGEYVAWRDRARSVRQLAAFSFFPAVIGDDDAVESVGFLVSCNFFLVDGLDRPTLGRLFRADDCGAPGQPAVVIISESLWHNRFASDPDLVGRRVQINNRPVIVIGVVRDRTSGWTRPVNVWLPYTSVTYFEEGRDVFRKEDFLWLFLAGRLTPGFTRSQAQAELNILARQQDELHPGRKTAVVANDGSWEQELELNASGRDLLLIGFFIATFNLVLFISCANVATLLLSRAAARRREIAVRLSLGASRIRLVRMLVTESLLLAAAAGAISVYLAGSVPKPLYHLVAKRLPDFPMPPDWRTFAYIAAVVMVTGILAGLAPALESLKVNLSASLKAHAGFGAAGGGTRIRNLLVSAQVALSMVLLVEAGLFARSEDRALRADPGYAPHKVIVTYLGFSDTSTLESARVRLHAIEDRMKALPGVRSVAFSDDMPLLRPDTVEVRPPARRDASQLVDVYTASPAFFETLAIPILRGREFLETDKSAVVISESLAKAFWPRQDPIGKMLTLPTGAAPVVGVAKDIDPMRVGGSDNPPAYRLRSVDARRNVMSVRFDAGASTGPGAIRAALRGLYPDLLAFPRSLQSWIDQITADLWNVASMIVVLGIVATVLAATGIYGAVSFSVSQRTRDLGIRMALGATPFHIVREVIVGGGKPVLQGLIAGVWIAVPTAVGLRETIRGSIIRVDSSEPLLYGAAALLLGAAAILAMLGPARRGATTDPLNALRCE